MNVRRIRSILGASAVGVLAVLSFLLGGDLFYAIPWWFRKGVGWVGFAGLGSLLARRLVRVGSGDDRPFQEDQAVPSSRWPAWLGPVAILGLAWPLLGHPENLGFGDWDWILGKYEAARRTIVLYGQFPWWDPWTRGGFPLAANPQCGILGVAMPLVLAFGTSVGLRLATLVCFGLAVEGARRLARLWVEDPPAAALVGLIYGLNGAVLVASVAGYHVTMCYPALPWMLYYVFRLDRRPADGLWLGAWGAFPVLNGIQYFTVYTALIVGLVWVRGVVGRPGAARSRYLLHSAIACGVFLGLTGWRLATTGLVCRDFPRILRSGYAESPWMILMHLLDRPSAAVLAKTDISYFWETTCYVGPVVLVLAAISLRGGWRWWHTLALACGWLASGSVAWYHPSYWLAHFPVFSTMHVVTRWRFMAMLGLALAAGSVVNAWRKDGRAGRRWLANLAILAIGADYLSYGWQVLPVAFSIAPDEARFPGPALEPGEIVQIDEWPGYAATLRGYGVVPGYEPMLGIDRRSPTARHYRGGPDSAWESRTDRGPIRPESWTPNRIEFRVEPGEEIEINQNPGSWWWVNGRPAFAGMRCAEPMGRFAAVADDRGRLVVEIRPKGLNIGLGIQAAGVAIVAGSWLARRGLPGGDPGGPGGGGPVVG